MNNRGLCFSVKRVYAALVFALLVCCPFYAYSFDEFQYNINAFGTVGMSTSDSDSLGFLWDYEQNDVTEKGHFSLLGESRLGLQFRGRYKWLSATVQLLGRDRISNGFNNFVNFAFLDFYFGRNLTVRVGKNPWEVYLNSDTRAVGYSQLAVNPSPEFYMLRFGESYSGIDIRYRLDLENGVFTLGGFVGTSDVDFLPEKYSSVDFRYKPVAGINVRYSNDQATFFASYFWANATDFTPLLREMAEIMRGMVQRGIPGAMDYLPMTEMDNTSTHNLIAGFSADIGNWTLLGEGNLFSFDKVGSTRMYIGYLTAGYHLGNWTPYGTLAGVHTTKDKLGFDPATFAYYPPEVAELMRFTNELYDRVYSSQTSINLGLRWDFYPGASLKWQWGHYRISDGGTALWRVQDEKAFFEGGNVNVFSTALDFAF